MDLQIPTYGEAAWLLAVFVVSSIVFHILFVVAFPLKKTWWKRADYIWILAATTGLYGSAATIRRAFAGQFTEIAMSRLEAKYDFLRDEIRFLSDAGVCRSFERTPVSPPKFDEIQTEFDAVCEYGAKILDSLPAEPPLSINDFRGIVLRDRPPVSSKMLLALYRDLDRNLDAYSTYLADYYRLRTASDYSAFDLRFALFAPNLLAVALATRLTKVTGELKLGKQASITDPSR